MSMAERAFLKSMVRELGEAKLRHAEPDVGESHAGGPRRLGETIQKIVREQVRANHVSAEISDTMIDQTLDGMVRTVKAKGMKNVNLDQWLNNAVDTIMRKAADKRKRKGSGFDWTQCKSEVC